MLSNESYKIFPFAPGIKWKVDKGKYIKNPSINYENWTRISENKNIVVLAYGGLIESFFSLSFIEAYGQLEPHRKFFWAGDSRFVPLVHYQKKALIKNVPNISSRFPTPIFLDAENNIYFNCLNNYLNVKSISGRNSYFDKRLIFKQIFANAMINWDGRRYIPKLNVVNNEFYNKWSKLNRFYDNKNFILLFDGGRDFSLHNTDPLGWDVFNIRQFISMLQRSNMNAVVVTDRPSIYNGLNVYVAGFDIDIILHLLTKASVVLSSTIDFLLLALCIGDAHLFCRKKVDKWVNINKSAEYFASTCVISQSKEFVPLEIYKTCEGIL